MWNSTDQTRTRSSAESIQFAPIAGRILFKDIRYHSTNMSARILLGHVTWRFWKWKIRNEQPPDKPGGHEPSARQRKHASKNQKYPARCLIHLEGMEWFLYNRSPAYDAIVERMKAANESYEKAQQDDCSESADGEKKHMDPSPNDSPPSESHDHSKPKDPYVPPATKIANADPISASLPPNERLARPLSPPISNIGTIRGKLDTFMLKKHQEPWQWQRDLLPIDVEISTGAVVVGNDATPIVTIAEFKKGKGSLETEESRSKLDVFKSVARFGFTGVKVIVRTNPDYTGALLDHGRRAYEQLVKAE